MRSPIIPLALPTLLSLSFNDPAVCSAADGRIDIEIGEARQVSMGGYRQTLSVTKVGAPISVSSFTLAFAWDSRALIYLGCEGGSALSQAEWEFEISDDSVQIANSPGSSFQSIRARGTFHGSDSVRSVAPDGEWLRLNFASTGNWCYDGAFAPVVFAFISCDDNTILSANRDTLFTVLKADTDSSWISTKRDCFGDSAIAPVGVDFSPDKGCRCDKKSEPRCLKSIVLTNGSIEFQIHGGFLMGYGDMNLNGIAYEVADHELLGRLLLRDAGALDPNEQYQRAQLDASDANADEVPATIADLQYIARVIIGDGKPYPKVNKKGRLAEAKLSRKNDIFTVASDNEVGAVRLVFEGRIAVERFSNLSRLDMDVLSSDSITTVLLYCQFGADDMTRKLARGKNLLLGVDKQAKLLRVETSDYEGNLLQTIY